jgi:type IV pilus assembly protein PilQ
MITGSFHSLLHLVFLHPVVKFDALGHGIFTLLAERQLSSGLVRVRDGQTLLLSGIIQETERSSCQLKFQFLEICLCWAHCSEVLSIPMSRNEVVVLLTPQILDDSDQSVWGYSYTPSEEIQDLIDRSPEPGQ